MPTYRSASGSCAEDLFIELFSDTFGAEKAGYLYSQYPFSDIYQNSRFADFLIENGGRKVAIEIDDEASHNPRTLCWKGLLSLRKNLRCIPRTNKFGPIAPSNTIWSANWWMKQDLPAKPSLRF